jgi:Protein of unknown function (DUF3618)
MGQDPAQVREEIERTRARMGEHVDALAYKADVPSRAKDKVVDVKDRIAAKVTGTMPDSGDVKDQARKAKGLAQDNPLGLAIGAVAVGFLAGLAIPATRLENERIGPVADAVKDRARDLGSDAVEHGKAVASDVAAAAKDAAQESGATHADEFKDEAGAQAKAARDDVSSQTSA